MVKIYASEKGEGKTKLLIDMANKAVGECGGDVVYIDDDKRPIFDLKHEIRFVEVKEFPFENYRELIQFIYGIFSQNNDIKQIYLDGIFKLIRNVGDEDFIKLISKLKAIGESNEAEFIIAANKLPSDLPKEISEFVVK
ncbi:MAG: hypothetical protein IJS61_06120 [Firmicutes bacterium]|nr:hypothetical protein [Bacillota bacterium]